MRLKTPLGKVLVFGEVLFDQYSDRTCLGGAPFNYAYHLHCMGVPVRLITKVGGDQAGQDVLKRMQVIGLPIDGVQMDIIHPTGMVEVQRDGKGEQEFNILPDQAYDYIDYDPFVESLISQDISLVYFGTLAQRHSASADTLAKILKTLSSRATFMMDINLRYPYYTPEVIDASLRCCDILKINIDELRILKDSLKLDIPVREIPRYLIEAYKIGFLCVTRGEDGSDIYEAGNTEMFHYSILPPEILVDTVGSGDAFSAMITAGYLAGLPRQTMVEQATEFASKICEIQGALPEDLAFYEPYRFE